MNTMKPTVKIRYEKHISPSIDGYVLYVNGNKTHTGYYNSIADLRRYFWTPYRSLLVAGYVYLNFKWERYDSAASY